MKKVTNDRDEGDILAYEISDDALEHMASAPTDRAGNYTLYFCTHLDLCPGP